MGAKKGDELYERAAQGMMVNDASGSGGDGDAPAGGDDGLYRLMSHFLNDASLSAFSQASDLQVESDRRYAFLVPGASRRANLQKIKHALAAIVF